MMMEHNADDGKQFGKNEETRCKFPKRLEYKISKERKN
jgi:hypothetical protein